MEQQNKFEVITGQNIPISHLPFSPAVKVGDFIFISGQASVDDTGQIIVGSFEEECRRSFDNLGRILKGAGLDFNDLVQVRNYVASQDDLALFNKIYKEYFNTPYPARTTLIGCLGSLLKFEVDAIAYHPNN